MTITSPKTLQVGWYMFQQGSIYQISQIDNRNGDVTLRDHHTGICIIRNQINLFSGEGDEPCLFATNMKELQDEITRHQPLAEHLIDGNGLASNLMDKATFMVSIVEKVQKRTQHIREDTLKQGIRLGETIALKQALSAPDIPIGLTTYYKYLQIYRQYHGNQAQIAASLRRSTYNQLRMSKAQLHFIDSLLQHVYLRPNPLSKIQVYRMAQSIMIRTKGRWVDPEKYPEAIPDALIADLFNPQIAISDIDANLDHRRWLVDIKLPSQRWFYNYIKHFEQQPEGGQALMVARYGQDFWEQTHRVYDTFITQAAAPLQFVFADHWQTDVLILDDKGTPIRLWLTLLIDAYSRSVLGMALLSEAPCIESIQQALLHAIWPKQSHHRWGIEMDWSCYGIPLHLSLDNAWAHHSHSLEDLSRSISMGGHYNAINLAFRPPYRGRYGAIIERIFGNFSVQMRQFLPGAIQQHGHKPYANAVKNARLHYDDLNRFVHEIILNYQHTPHSGLKGMTPHEKWIEGLQLGLPLVPPRTPATEHLFWRMMPDKRQLSRKGIAAFGMHYHSAILNGAPRINRRGETIQYTIRYMPTDISRLAVFHDGSFVTEVYAKELRLADGTTHTLSVAERDMARQLARKMNHPTRDWLQFTEIWQQAGQPRHSSPNITKQPLLPPANTDNYADLYTSLLERFTTGGQKQ